MFKGLFHWIAGIFQRRPYQIHFERHENRLQLKANKGKKAIPVAYLAEHYEELRSLKGLQSSEDILIVSISMLSEIKQVLSNLDNKRFEVLISEGADNLQAVSMPEGFEVRYVWVDGPNYVKQTVADGVAYLGDGWFLLRDSYWRVEGTSEEDDKWLRMEAITGEDILTLVTRKVTEWKARGLPYVCAVKYSDEPLFRLTIKEVTEDAVELHFTFRDDPVSAKEIPSFVNHIMVADTIMPGFAPAKLLGGMLTKTGTYRLRGELIPHFLMNVLPKVLKWTDGKKEELRSRHRVIQDECELIISLVREEHNGIGVVSALPEFACGSFRRKAEEISREMSNYKRFVRIEPGWVPIERLRQTGIGPLGVADDGTPLSPIPLTPHEVLNRGSDRLRGPCSRIEAPELRFPQGKDAQDTARLHLEFLRAWGLPGGVVGERDFHVDAFHEMFSTLLQKSPQSKILVIAAQKTFDSLGKEWGKIIAARFEGNRRDPEFKATIQGVVLATPKALRANPAITSLKWTVLCLLEADSLVKSGTSQLFKNLLQCRKDLTIGLFSGIDFLNRTSTREALSQIFGMSSLLWKYGLRDPAKHAPSAPLAYQLPPRQQTAAGSSRPAEVTIGTSTGSKSIPIPPRPVYVEPASVATETKSSIELKDLGIRFEITYSIGHSGSADNFIQDAKKAVNRRGAAVAHVPFMSYWPTYDSMTSSQLQWYFYWRSMVREGKYLDSDLSYIFVFIYELINNVGVKDARDGYEQLKRVWFNYRDRQPKLDNYLIDWIFDYALINKYPADPMEFLRDAVKMNAIPRYNEVDLVLPGYITGSLVELPLALIDSISNYRILRSKFFNEGYQGVVEEFVPRSLDEVNKHMTKKFGTGIFGLFKPKSYSPVERYPYQSALYSGRLGKIKIGNIVSYSQHAPLRDFIASTVKHTENRLREANNFKGRLRGYNIEPQIQTIIDNLIPSAPSKTVPVQPPKHEIVIDFSRVQTLIKQSDQVLQMLQTGEEKGSEKSAGHLILEAVTSQHDRVEKITRPEGTPDHLLTDLDSVHEVLMRLDNDEKGLINALMRHGWEVEASVLNEEFPGTLIEFMVDRVNSLSLEILGDLLIVAENQMKVVAEDFRDELEYLILLNAGAPVMSSQTGEQDPVASGDLPEEWVQFRSVLKEHQHQALRAILTMEDPSQELARLADKNAIMPEFLIDSINELALDTIGDIIIEPGSSPPAIEEEDLEFVRKLIQA